MSIDETKTKTFSNNATLKLLGYDYQKLFALECCLNAKPGDIIYIECYGDVATKDISYELKKRDEKYNMTDQSPDFWKTLKNFVKEWKSISQFSKLVLHTTAFVDKNSIFFDWNSKSADQKLRLIEIVKQNPNQSIKKFTDIIFGFNDTYTEDDLLDILKKLEIDYSQSSIKEKCEEIKNHPAFLSVDEKLRDQLIEQLYGYISMKAIEDSSRWKIIYNDFSKDIQHYFRSFQQNEIPYPDLLADVEYTGHEKYRFIDELRAIEFDSEVESAVIDYLRAEKNSFKLIETGGPFIQESIDKFEFELNNKMINQKKHDVLDLDSSEITTPIAIKKSKALFLKCKLFNKMKIRGVQPIEMYYQHGKMHKIVDEQNFCWKFSEEDLI